MNGSSATPPPGIIRRIYANLGRLIGGKAGAGIISVLYMLIAVRVLGPRDYGVLVLVHTFAITVGGIVEFPGWHAVVRYGALAVAAGDEARMIRLLRFTTIVEAVGGALAVATAAVLGLLLGAKLGWSQAAVDFAAPYSLAVLASIRATPAGYLQLCGRFDLLGAHVLVSPMVRLAGAGVIALTGGGLHAFLVVWLAAALLEWSTMWLLGIAVLRRRAPGARLIGGVAGVRTENVGILRFMLGANADATFSDLAPRIAPMVIGWVSGPVAAALYAVAQRVSAVISQPGQLLGQASYAEFARLIAGGRGGAAIRRTLARSILVAMGLSIPALLIIAFAAHPLARMIGGHAFERAGDIMLLLAVARSVLLVGPPASAALVALGRPGLSVGANLLTSLGLLPILPMVVLAWGLVGAGLHSLLQAIIAAAILGFFVWRVSRAEPPQDPSPA